jgi:thiol:disulfide interchange protein DsbD
MPWFFPQSVGPFGKTEIYRREARIRVPVTSDDKARGIVKLKVTSQGCADIGVCYVPLEQFVEARLPGRSSITPAAVRQGGSR